MLKISIVRVNTPKPNDLSGRQFGRWRVVSYDETSKGSEIGAHWHCQCECGVTKSILGHDLRRGSTTSCKSCAARNRETPNHLVKLHDRRFGKWTVLSYSGSGRKWICQCECGAQKLIKSQFVQEEYDVFCNSCGINGHTVHGMSGTPTYRTWNSMMSRCHNPKSPDYRRYGASGIFVCQRWHKIENFVEDMGLRPEGTTIDRKDQTKGYDKGNCRWATASEQQSHLSSARRFEYKGALYSINELSKNSGVPYQTIYSRLRKGLSVDDAIIP